jgi:biopolymer transport protein ExbB
MKQSVFITVLLVVAIAISFAIFYLVFGNAANFKDPAMTTPANIFGQIYKGGWVVPLLLTLSKKVL